MGSTPPRSENPVVCINLELDTAQLENAQKIFHVFCECDHWINLFSYLLTFVSFKIETSLRNNPSGVLKDPPSDRFQSCYLFRTYTTHCQLLCTNSLRHENPPSTRHDWYTVLQQVYQSVILSKLLQYASCAWWGFTKASDRQWIDNFIRRSVKSGFCPADLQSFRGLCETAEENCLIRFCTIHCMFCISFFHVSPQQARIQLQIT